MHKQIVFSLLLIFAPSIQAMDLAGTNHLIYSYDVLSFVADELYKLHESDLQNKSNRRDFGKDIAALSSINKNFNGVIDAVAKNIVRKFAHQNNWTDFKSAEQLGCKKICSKMNYFFAKAYAPNEQFTTDDVQGDWYFNATMIYPAEPLLLAIIKIADVNKVKMVLESGVVLTNENSRCPFEMIDNLKKFRFTSAQKQRDFLTIEQLLLQHGVVPFEEKMDL
jgi:hypothetical protein